jgi:YVTN family beta-propeller protein
MNDFTRRSFLILLVFGFGLLVLGLVTAVPVAIAQQAPTPFPLYALPDTRLSSAVSSNTLALGKDNRTLVAANMLSNTISIIALGNIEKRAEIAVGQDPRSVALTNDNNRAVTANRADGTLSVVDLVSLQTETPIPLNGLYPYGVVVAENDVAYVSLQGSGEVVAVDLNQREVVRRVSVPDSPAGLALWGDFLYVTHFWSGQISLIYVPSFQVAATISTGLDTGLSQNIVVDVLRGLAYVPQTRSNAQNPDLTFDAIVFPVVNQIDLRSLTVNRRARIALDSADRPVNQPFAAALDRFKQLLYVANAGSDSVSVIDLTTGLARAHIPVGPNPRGILLNNDNTLLLVHNGLEGSLAVIETRDLSEVDTLPITDLNIPVDTILAQQYFYGASRSRLSYNNWVSCANCHFDGLSDGRVWQGFADGPRNTPLLFNLPETFPYNWSASWDELADVELKIRWLQSGRGLIPAETVNEPLGNPHAGASVDLDVLASYLASLQGPPARASTNPELVARGQIIFEQRQCAVCHTDAVFTDLQKHDVGTGTSSAENAGSEYDTPSLRWLALSAPYFHDGSAATLRDVFLLPGAHQLLPDATLADIDALVAYLLTLPQ